MACQGMTKQHAKQLESPAGVLGFLSQTRHRAKDVDPDSYQSKGVVYIPYSELFSRGANFP